MAVFSTLRTCVVAMLVTASTAHGFSLFRRSLAIGQDTSAGEVTTTSATAAEAEPSDMDLFKGLLLPAFDAWKEDAHLQFADRMVKGDVLGSFKQMLAGSHLDEMFSDVATVHEILNKAPWLMAIKGLGQVGGRRLEELPPDAGSQALQHMRDFTDSVLKGADMLLTPQKMAENLQKWATSEDPEVQDLLVKSEQGDGRAMLQLQSKIFKTDIGDFVDLMDLGFSGERPPVMQQVMDMLNNDEDDIMSLAHNNNPEYKEWIMNPWKAVSDAMEFAGAEFPKFEPHERF